MKNAKGIIIGIIIGGVVFSGITYILTRNHDKKLLMTDEEITIDQNINNNQNSNKDNSKNKTISGERAKEIIFEKVPKGNLVEFGYEEDETPSYDGKILKENIEYEFSIDAKTGEIIQFDEDFEPNKNNNSNVKVIPEDKAKDIMLKKVGGGKFLEFKLDKENKIPKYEGSLLKDNIEYDIKINAQTGEIIGFDKEKYDGK